MRLIVFSRRQNLTDYVSEAKKLDPFKVFYASDNTLRSPEGLIDKLVVIERARDVDILRGMNFASVHLDNPQTDEVVDVLRAITGRRVE